jgi:signal transduction histidine kinase
MKTSPGDPGLLLDEANTIVSDLMTRVRNLSLDLRPAMLDDLGLLPALLWHFERYSSQTRVKVNFEHTGLDRQFQSEISTAIYRIVQEALNNVSKYASVEDVTVRAWSTTALLCAQVEDEGKGFVPGEVTPSSSGLIGMQERAHLLGGKLTIETTPGAGTRVTAELPLPAEPRPRKKEKQS